MRLFLPLRFLSQMAESGKEKNASGSVEEKKDAGTTRAPASGSGSGRKRKTAEATVWIVQEDEYNDYWSRRPCETELFIFADRQDAMQRAYELLDGWLYHEISDGLSCGDSPQKLRDAISKNYPHWVLKENDPANKGDLTLDYGGSTLEDMSKAVNVLFPPYFAPTKYQVFVFERPLL